MSALVSQDLDGGFDAQVLGRRVPWRQRAARLLGGTGVFGLGARLRSMVRNELHVLAYHRVLTLSAAERFDFDIDLVSASAEQFREQMVWLRRHFHPLCFRDVVAAIDAGSRLPARAVVVTFDDGYDDNYRIAFPILRELGIPAVFFVSTGHIDSGLPFAYDWLVHLICVGTAERLHIPELGVDTPLPRSLKERRALAALLLNGIKEFDADTQAMIIERLGCEWNMPRTAAHHDCKPMTWQELREMRDAGMEIDSHGINHHMLAKLKHAEMVSEIIGSQAAIERELGQPSVALSYPVGGDDAFNKDVWTTAANAGYRIGCSYINGINAFPVAPLNALRRLHVESNMDLAWFAGILSFPEMFAYRVGSRGR